MTTQLTDTQPAASNQPAPPRTFGWLAGWLRHWLGIADQRRDFDALGVTLGVRDQTIETHRLALEQHSDAINAMSPRLNQTTAGVVNLTDRLQWHEQRVSGLAGSKKAYDLALKREKARREQLIGDHPELTVAEQRHVRSTGQLPNGRAAPPDAS